MNKRTLLVSLLIPLLMVAAGYSQTISKVGTSAANYLKIPVDAIGTARGEAVVTGFANPASMYYNPSTLALISQPSTHFSYVNWYEGITLNHAAMAIPVSSWGVFGVNLVSMNSGQMEITTELDQDGTGDYFDVGGLQLGLGFARSLTDHFMIGANAKVLRETIMNSHAQGFALDIGGRYITPWEGLVLGFSISNFGTKMQMTGDDLLTTNDPDPLNSGNNEIINAYYATDRFDIPLRMVIGTSWHVVDSPLFGVVVEADGVFPSDNEESMNAGIDFAIANNLLHVSAGATQIFLPENDPKFSIGGGLTYRIIGGVMLRADYAVQTHTYFSHNEHFSISLKY